MIKFFILILSLLNYLFASSSSLLIKTNSIACLEGEQPLWEKKPKLAKLAPRDYCLTEEGRTVNPTCILKFTDRSNYSRNLSFT